MSKKITIKEEDVDEPYEEIIEQVDNTLPEPPPPPDVSLTSSAKNAVHFAAEPKPQAPQEPVQQMTPPPVYYQQAPRQIPLYEQMRLEKQRAHLEKIQRLSMFIA